MMYAFISSVYRIVEAGLGPLDLILVGTVLEVSAFLFEVPTGVVADVYSRRLSLILGALLTGAGFILEGLFPVFAVILAAQVLWGVSYTFRSGALQAWIADELDNKSIGQVLLRGSQAAQIGAIIGIAVGVSVGSGYFDPPIPDLAVPLVLGGCISILLGLFMALAMPEEGFRPPAREERESWGTMEGTFRQGVRLVRGRPALIAIFAIALFYGASSETFDRFSDLHILEAARHELPGLAVLSPIAWWGMLSAATMLLGIAGVEALRRTVDIDVPRVAIRVLSVTNILAIASIVWFAFAGSFGTAVAAYLAYRVSRGLGGPALTVWTNQQLESGVRATVFSMRSQMDALGQVATGPAMGVLATSTTVRVALVAAALLLAPPQAIFARVTRLRNEDETAT
jgi:DHA3 family tetracycline resistance protein-like MFS transporter